MDFNPHFWRRLAFTMMLAVLGIIKCGTVLGQTACSNEINLLAKYGVLPKCQELIDIDDRFISSMDKQYSSDRRKASEAAASRGWQYFMQGNLDDAMRRFNQAWLLDKSNGTALWGMGAVESNRANHREAVALFSEAATFIGRNLRFQLDYARSIGIAGTELKDSKLIDTALIKFEAIFNEYPTSAINLQNWAMTLYSVERYQEASEKMAIARATSESRLLSQEFGQALQKKLAATK